MHKNTEENKHKILNILHMLRPRKLLNFDKIRMGRFFDGGYIMIDDFKNIDAAYSIGINDDPSWDLDVAAKGIPVFQYDHTIDAAPVEHHLLYWRKTGLAPIVDEKEKLDTLEGMICKNKHEGSRNLILKCDIENHEWDVFSDISCGLLDKFRQIAIEIHGAEQWVHNDMFDKVRKAILNLTSNHYLVHIHANNNAPVEMIGGIPVPYVLELTLARRDIGEFILSDETFPTRIDMPNNKDISDYYLGNFTFYE